MIAPIKTVDVNATNLGAFLFVFICFLKVNHLSTPQSLTGLHMFGQGWNYLPSPSIISKL